MWKVSGKMSSTPPSQAPGQPPEPPSPDDPWKPGKNDEKRRKENERKAKATADELYPGEKWISADINGGIYRSSRRPIGKESYEDELRDAQILRDSGSTVYLIPELRSDKNKKYDAIVDGFKMEFKNVGGNANTLQKQFLVSRAQAPNVFINLETSKCSA